MTIRVFAQLLLIGLVCASAHAQDRARLEAVAQDYFAAKQFMGSVLVAKDGEVLLNKSYGFANVEWEVPNTPTTKFRLGSITKQFTAACILLLEERGKLSVEDPIQKHFSDAPNAWDGITIRHVLNHTSGIPSFTSFPDYRTYKLSASTSEKAYKLYRDKPLDFKPGEKWNYSNSGYLLLGYLVEKISGQSYEQFVRENIFTPLGMKDTGLDSNSAIILHRASGYSPGPGGIVNADYIHMSIPQGAGALYSTTEDLLRWNRGLFGGKLLKPESVEKMLTPSKNDYAFGIAVRTANGRKIVNHGGGIEGFNTSLSYSPEQKVTVVVLSNQNGSAPDRMGKQLEAAAHGEAVKLMSERKEVPVAAEVLARYPGVYEITPQFSMAVTLEDGKLMTQATNQGKIQIFPLSESRFFTKVMDAELEFGRDDKGAVTHLTLFQNGREIKGVRK